MAQKGLTNYKDVVALLGNVRRSISLAMGMRFTRGMDLVSLDFKHRM
jgi:hypothetical protein